MARAEENAAAVVDLDAGAAVPSSLERFFRGRLVGEGEVSGLTGAVLRRFSVVFAGVWSEPHRALHLDEEVAYEDGGALSRRWAVHVDAEGVLSGVDAVQGGRLRGRQIEGGLRLTFDRPRTPGSNLTLPKVRLEFQEVQPGEVVVDGRTTVLGLIVRRTAMRMTRATG